DGNQLRKSPRPERKTRDGLFHHHLLSFHPSRSIQKHITRSLTAARWAKGSNLACSWEPKSIRSPSKRSTTVMWFFFAKIRKSSSNYVENSFSKGSFFWLSFRLSKARSSLSGFTNTF